MPVYDEELKKIIDSSKPSDKNYDDILRRLTTLENQNKNQQQVIDKLTHQVNNQISNKSNERDEWIKQDKEMIDKMIQEIKTKQIDISKKQNELKERRKEAENIVREYQKLGNNFNSLNKRVNDQSDQINNHSTSIEISQRKLEEHDNQFD